MKAKPLAHRWEPIPVHAGPDEWRCVRCGVESTLQAGHVAPPPYCAPTVGKIVRRAATAAPAPASVSLALEFLPSSHV